MKPRYQPDTCDDCSKCRDHRNWTPCCAACHCCPDELRCHTCRAEELRAIAHDTMGG